MHKHKLGPNSAVSRLPEIRLCDKNARTYVFDPYLVDMARVYKEGKEDRRLIGENTVKEMFHTAVGLLSVSLVSMDKTTIYEALFEKSSVTLLFISRDDECTERLMETNSLVCYPSPLKAFLISRHQKTKRTWRVRRVQNS